jgi:hypothetical protein
MGKGCHCLEIARLCFSSKVISIEKNDRAILEWCPALGDPEWVGPELTPY